VEHVIGRSSDEPTGDRLPAPHPTVAVADFDDELVVLVPSARQAHHLDPAMSVLFDACRRGDTMATLVEELATASGASPEEMAAEVRRALEELLECGLLRSDE
jgi:PqqD family protein of HPr-rel-A system